MKKLFTILVAGALVLTVVTKSNAKGGADARISVGLELGLPMGGTFGDATSTGFGLSGRYEMPMGDNLGLTGTLGYLMFAGKELSYDLSVPGATDKWSTKTSQSNIPIMVGGKYYFTEQQNGFYLGLALGLVLNSSKTTWTTTTTQAGKDVTTSTDYTSSGSGLGYAPSLGYHIANMDFQLADMFFTSSSTETVFGQSVTVTTGAAYLNLRVAYVLGGK